MQTQDPLLFLYEAYEKTLKEIRNNRKAIITREDNNKDLQKQLDSIKDSMAELLDALIREDGSLYQTCKKRFGIIDKRFYRICSMLGKRL
jgi:L-lactate utilization protein LutB